MTMRKDLQNAISGPFVELARAIKGFDPNQPRDDHGRWTDAGAVGSATDAIEKHASDVGEIASEISDHATDLKYYVDQVEERRQELAKEIADYEKEYGPGTENYDPEVHAEDLASSREMAADDIASMEADAREQYGHLSSHAAKLVEHARNIADKVSALAPKK